MVDDSNAYPSDYCFEFTALDCTKVLMRPIRATDGKYLVDLFNRMSPQTLYKRFLRKISSLPDDLVKRFSSVDYRGSFAMVAEVREASENAIVAVARYGSGSGEDSTELAIAVRDDWQNRGLGSELLSKTVDMARRNGIVRFTGIMDPQNHTIMHLLVKLGYQVSYSPQDGFLLVDIEAGR